MHFTRLVAGTVTAGLLGLTPLAVSAPANATDTWSTTTTATPYETRVVFGDTVDINVDISSSDGYSPGGTDGTSTLYAMEAGTTAWVPVATAENTYASFYDVKPTVTTTYKVVYSGFTATASYQDNYTPSESPVFTVGVARKITYPSSGFVLKGKVTPNYGKKKIVIKVSKKKNKGFKSFKTIKTTSTGTYKVALPRRRGTWYWSFTVKGDSKYLANGFLWRTWVS